MQLASSAEQLQVVSNALDVLRHESGNAIQDLRRLLAEARNTTKGERVVNFVNVKSYEGGKFTGKIGEYKPWSKRAKIFCNSQCRGFAAALERAEAQAGTVDLGLLGLTSNAETVRELDEKLYDFLVTYTAEEALENVERFPGSGFEAWRQLKARYSPTGGRADLDRSLRILLRKPCKSLSDLPAAIDHLERDLAHHDAMAGYKWPEQHKILLLVQMCLEALAQYLKITFVADQTDFQKVRDSILRYSNTERLADTYRGAKAMEIDNVNDDDGAGEEEIDQPWEDKLAKVTQMLEDLNYMGKGKGKKGNGKGKKGEDGKGRKGEGKGNENRVCHWCQKIGHLVAECRAKAAGKPKTKPAVNAASLDEWEEDTGMLEAADTLEMELSPLLEYDLSNDSLDGWTEGEDDDNDDDPTGAPATSPAHTSPATSPASISPTSKLSSSTVIKTATTSPDPWRAADHG